MNGHGCHRKRVSQQKPLKLVPRYRMVLPSEYEGPVETNWNQIQKQLRALFSRETERLIDDTPMVAWFCLKGSFFPDPRTPSKYGRKNCNSTDIYWTWLSCQYLRIRSRLFWPTDFSAISLMGCHRIVRDSRVLPLFFAEKNVVRIACATMPNDKEAVDFLTF